MNVITHALFGWAVSTRLPGASRVEKAWIVAAAVAPDLDGLGILAELPTRDSASPIFWWSEYHHLLFHNLLFAVLLSLAAAMFNRRRAVLGLAVFASVNLHYLCDLAGSRGPDGYQWPLFYLWPFSDQPALTVRWQWQLNAWPNVAVSMVLLAYTFWLARRRATSPLELFSRSANKQFVGALRRRFPLPGASGT
jgi:inner membrane protein